MQHEVSQPVSPRKAKRRAVIAIAAMVILSLALLQVDFSSLGEYGYLGVFGLALAGNATVIVPAPVFVTAFAAGRTLNPWLVGLLSGLGAAIGESTGYIVGRAGRGALHQNQRLQRITQNVEKYGPWAVLFFAAIPNPVMDIAGMAAGMLRMPFWKYLLACAVGKTIRFTLLALIGSGIG